MPERKRARRVAVVPLSHLRVESYAPDASENLLPPAEAPSLDRLLHALPRPRAPGSAWLPRETEQRLWRARGEMLALEQLLGQLAGDRAAGGGAFSTAPTAGGGADGDAAQNLLSMKVRAKETELCAVSDRLRAVAAALREGVASEQRYYGEVQRLASAGWRLDAGHRRRDCSATFDCSVPGVPGRCTAHLGRAAPANGGHCAVVSDAPSAELRLLADDVGGGGAPAPGAAATGVLSPQRQLCHVQNSFLCRRWFQEITAEALALRSRGAPLISVSGMRVRVPYAAARGADAAVVIAVARDATDASAMDTEAGGASGPSSSVLSLMAADRCLARADWRIGQQHSASTALFPAAAPLADAPLIVEPLLRHAQHCADRRVVRAMLDEMCAEAAPRARLRWRRLGSAHSRCEVTLAPNDRHGSFALELQDEGRVLLSSTRVHGATAVTVQVSMLPLFLEAELAVAEQAASE